MIHRCKYTHYGWMGICPVHIADPKSDCPTIDARYWWMEPLHDLSLMFFNAINFVLSHMSIDYEPNFPLWVCGELDKPVFKEYDDGCD